MAEKTSMGGDSLTENSRRRFMTVEQVAEELNVGTPLIRSLLKTGELRGIQIGGRGLWRIGASDLETYIEAAYMQVIERIAAGDVDLGTEPE